MAKSPNVVDIDQSHPFEALDISDNLDFDPFEEFSKGTKNKNNSVTLDPASIIHKSDKSTPGDDDTDDDDDSDDDTDDKDDEEDKDDGADRLDKFVDRKISKQTAEDDKDENDDDEINPNQAFYDLMVKTGRWTEVEGFDGTDESLEKAIDDNQRQSIEAEIDEFVESAFEKNPDGRQYGKALMSHLANGGRIKDFFDIYQNEDINAGDLDDEDQAKAEAAAEAIMNDYHRRIGWKPEKIAATIRSKKEKGTLIDAAKDVADPYEDLKKAQKEELAKRTAQEDIAAKKRAMDRHKSISALITENETIRNVKIGKTKQEKQKIADYMLSPTADIGDGNKVPQMYVDMRTVQQDPEWNIVLASAIREFKEGKKPGKQEEKKTGSTKDTIKEILSNRTAKAVHSASTDTSDKHQAKSAKQAWAGIVN